MSTVSDAMLARPCFCAGKWLHNGDPFPVRSPYDGKIVATVARATQGDVKDALLAASVAFEQTRRMPAHERQRVLHNIHRYVSDRHEEFAQTICLEAGKPIKTARAEVDRALFTLQIAAEEATRIYGEYLPLDLQAFATGRWGLVRRFPLGPIAAITPFNFPLNLVCHKLAPAIAAGCTMVLKPASQTPLSALLLAQAVEHSGWPIGGLSVLPMANTDASLLVEDETTKLLTFTGSAEVGWKLKARAGKKRVTLELGGNAGCIVHSDADLAHAAARCVAGGFSYAGQSCISVQRILVEHTVLDRFLAEFIPAVQKLRVGDPKDDATDVGPMIRESDAHRADEWIAEAVKRGARLLCGGQRTGSVLQPTVLTGTLPSERVNCAEIFA
ncbi:MAG TPA: aldehyde dehydrogenase family protein, partial [Candidatus Acidoferrales bacterium]|nr:aldehyde dehydrogenase family protein [Candidatus Acidoferrales bacterium]